MFRYLIFAGDDYYPSGGAKDLVDERRTLDYAKKVALKQLDLRVIPAVPGYWGDMPTSHAIATTSPYMIRVRDVHGSVSTIDYMVAVQDEQWVAMWVQGSPAHISERGWVHVFDKETRIVHEPFVTLDAAGTGYTVEWEVSDARSHTDR